MTKIESIETRSEALAQLWADDSGNLDASKLSEIGTLIAIDITWLISQIRLLTAQSSKP